MKANKSKYKEKLDNDFYIQRKITSTDAKSDYHIHDEFELVLVLSDNISCAIEGKTYFLPQNSLLLFNSMDLHHLSRLTPGLNDRYVLYFKPEYIQSFSTEQIDLLGCYFYRPFRDAHILTLTENEANEVLSILNRINDYYYETEDNLYGKELHIKFMLGELLLNINHTYQKAHNLNSFDTNSNYNLIYSVINYIHKNYTLNLSLDDLSKQFFISKFYLCTMFKKVTGMSPNQYIIKCRLMKAKELLMNNVSVDNVCSKVGYNNLSHFSRAFKKYSGQSPKKFQLQNIIKY